MIAEFEIDPHSHHLKDCDAYGGFRCNCDDRVERAILRWARAYLALAGKPVPVESIEELQALFDLWDNPTWR